MCYKDELKYNCGTRTSSRCVTYDRELPDLSKLQDRDCITIEETTKDLYEIVESFNESTDLSELGKGCINYEEEERGRIQVKEALLKLEEEVCNLKNIPTTGEGGSVDLSRLDTSCLVDECDTGFSTLEKLLQGIIDKVCQLSNDVNQATDRNIVTV